MVRKKKQEAPSAPDGPDRFPHGEYEELISARDRVDVTLLRNLPGPYPTFRIFASYLRELGWPDILPPDMELQPGEGFLVIDPIPEEDPYDRYVDNVEKTFDLSAEPLYRQSPSPRFNPDGYDFWTNRFDIDDATYRNIYDLPGVIVVLADDTDLVRPSGTKLDHRFETVTAYEHRTGQSILDTLVFPDHLL